MNVSIKKTGIEIKAGFFPLAYFLFFCPPKIEINGEVNKKYWGTHFFSLEPGEYLVKIYFRYFFKDRGQSSLSVFVNQGQKVKIKYKAPMWMTAPGKIKIL